MTLARRSSFSSVGIAAVALAGAVQADPLLINEIYTDPPGGFGDRLQEYIEIIGTPNQVLGNIYFIQIEPEPGSNPAAPTQGDIDLGFDLTGVRLGSNGKLVIAPPNSGAILPAHNFDPAATLIQVGSDLDEYSQIPGVITNSSATTENSGGTFAIIDIGSGPAPTFAQDLDTDDDGTLDLPAEWTILDSIGFTGENDENAVGGLYGEINFFAGNSTINGLEEVPPGEAYDVDPSTVVLTGFEIEYVSRFGDGGEWFVANLTDGPNTTRGGEDVPIVGANHVISAADTSAGSQTGDAEVSIDLPYGLSPLTPGGANIGTVAGFLDGDYNGDGFVSQADLDLVLLNWGDATTPAEWLAIDQFDGDLVSQNELDGVLLNWGDGTPPALTIPAPSTAISLLAGGALLITRRRRAI